MFDTCGMVVDMQHVAFVLDDQRYAVALDRVVEVAPRVALKPLLGGPDIVCGLFSCRGQPVVAIDLRKKLGAPPRPPSMDDQILIVRGSGRWLGLMVDRVQGVVTGDVQRLDRTAEAPELLRGDDGGLSIVADVEHLFSSRELVALDEQLRATP